MSTLPPFSQLFIRFLESDAETLEQLRAHQLHFTEHELHFTLPQLHRFLTKTAPSYAHTPYLTFRKQLFNSPINRQLSDYHSEIFIVDNTQHVDRSTYGLRRIPTPFAYHKQDF